MLIVERQQRLIEFLKERGSANLDALSTELGVSASTVRRDLDVLEQRGLLSRTHGGAVFRGAEPEPVAPPAHAFAARMAAQVDAKRAIGAAAAALVEPNMTLLLDAGSTVVYAAQQITVRPIQIVTTSLAITQLFANDEQAEVTVLGGQLYPRTSAMVGAITRRALGEVFADLCFMSLAGLDESAAYNINMAQTRVEQAMLEQADRTVLLMDASKFGRKSLVKVAELRKFDSVLADGAVEQGWRSSLGDRLVTAAQ